VSRFSKRFVAVVFFLLAVSFIVSTGSIVSEFWGPHLVPILTANSYLFVFFPTLGIVAMVAFYIPAVIFADLYLNRTSWFLKTRFVVGGLMAIGAALFFADALDKTDLRSIWEVSPAALENDRASRPVCEAVKGRDRPVCAQPILPTMEFLRQESLKRVRISPFIRDCHPDTKVEANPINQVERYCFPAGEKLKAAECCVAQRLFAQRVGVLAKDPLTQSRAAEIDRYLLPFKSFFIIMMVLISVLLIAWPRTIRERYGPWLKPMERGIQIGAVAMLFWPIMDYAYQQTLDVLYGPRDSFPLRLSLVTVPWVLLLTFHFKDRIKDYARVGQTLGGIASVIAFFRYQDISDWSSKLVGLGAAEAQFVVLVATSVIILILLFRWLPRSLAGEERESVGGAAPPSERPQT